MKITEFLKLLTPAANDVIVGVDVSEDITKKIELQDLPISNATQTALDAKIAKYDGTTYDVTALTAVTQAEYDAIGTKSATTLYFII